jgi:hypothetical protein
MQGTLLFGQVTKITDIYGFLDDHTIKFFFRDLTHDVRVDNAYNSLGVTFDGERATSPTAVWWDPWHISGDRVVRNVGEATAQPTSALITRFRYPVSKVGFVLGNGHEDTVATIRAFAPTGDFLGQIEQGGIDQNDPVFVGLQTANTTGIATVVLDYGDSAAEQTSSLFFNYTSPRTFRTYLAQIANGPTGVGTSLQTVLQVQGLSELQGTDIVLRLFDQAGEPLTLNLSGEENSVFEFDLFTGVKRLISDGASEEMAIGYVSIESTRPIAAQAIFRTLDPDGIPIHEAGVEATEGRPTVRIPVEHDPVSGLDTGVAIVNVGEREGVVILSLRNEVGAKPEEVGNAPNFILQPGEHRAVFITEQFEFLVDTPFVGSLSVISQEPAAVTSLRTYKGVAWSSLPLGSTQK